VQIVALVKDLAVDLGVELGEPANLPILLGHQLLIHRGDLYEQVVVGEIEIRGEKLGGLAIAIPGDRERAGLVIPFNAIEVQEECKLPLTVVSERDL
jgi:hypothetical protein